MSLNRKALKEMSDHLLDRLGYAKVHVPIWGEVDVTEKARQKIEEMGEYKALQALESVETDVREWRRRQRDAS